jgi:hypothetical protein
MIFFIGQPLNSSPTVKKYEYKCPYQFAEQIEVNVSYLRFRSFNLHIKM